MNDNVLHEAHLVGCDVEGMGLRPLSCSDCGFESHRVHGCLSVVNVACCQVELSATS
jgi:hypothetical protein